jgi:hypothetical protein
MNRKKRPSTAKQITASRANGKRSHGPVTPEGLAISSQNAVKWGFFASTPLLAGESESQFTEFRAHLFEAYLPTDGEENLLVERIVDAAWRLRRVPAVEAGLYSTEHLEEQAERARRKARDLIHHRLQLDSNDASDPKQCRELLDMESEIREELNSPRYALGRAFRRDVRGGGGLTCLSHCETRLERGLFRALRELRIRRYIKKQNEPGAPANPPTKQDFHLERSPLHSPPDR